MPRLVLMAFVPGFEFDIFISYSHFDNAPVESVRWVEKFHDRLKIQLHRMDGTEDIKIWRDDELDGNQKFHQVLHSRLEKSAILLCLNSPGYLKSEYCSKEREWFEGAHRNLLRIGECSRIFNVMLFDIPVARWPDAFRGELGFQFFHVDRPENEGFPLQVRGKVFSDRLHSVSVALLKTLLAMRQGSVKPPGYETSSASEPGTAERRPRLFFGKVSHSLKTRKNQVIAELKRDGFEVLSEIPPPYENPEHDAVVEQRIKQADLAIHLLDEFAGDQIPGEMKGYIERQVEIGRNARVPQLIWAPKDPSLGEIGVEEPEELAYRSFLGELAGGSRNAADYDFVVGAPSEIAHEIRDRLERRKAPPQIAAARPTVLLDFHATDASHSYDVYQYLEENGILPKLNRADDDRWFKRLDEQLAQVNALIVFFGEAERDWVLNRVIVAARIAASGRYPVKAYGIYLAPPRKPKADLPDDWRPLVVYPMDNTDGFDPGSLTPLLSRLNAGENFHNA